MLKYTPVMGAIAAALFSALPAHATTSEAELQQLRSQVQELRQQYEQRLQALEARLNQAQQATATPGTVPAAPATTTQAATATFPIATQAAAPSASRKGNSAFNPAIGMILTGTYANLSKDPENWELSGFNLGGDGHGVGPGKRGFSLGESEITFSANVDNLAYGALTLGLDGDNEVEVEEAFVQSTALPYGLTLKGGRFYGALGYQNEQHAHTWSFVDLPLAHQAFLGGHYKQEGAQLKWVLPTTQYVELGAELGNGSAFPGSDRVAMPWAPLCCRPAPAAMWATATAGVWAPRGCAPMRKTAHGAWHTITAMKAKRVTKKPVSAAPAAFGCWMACGNGRPMAMPSAPISRCRVSTSAARSRARPRWWRAPTQPSMACTAAASRVGMCRACTNLRRNGAWACDMTA